MAIVRVTEKATEQARQLPTEIQGRTRNVIRRLEKWPVVSGVKKLSGNLAGWYRIRVAYRVRFRVEGDTVTVDKIGHRKDVYED